MIRIVDILAEQPKRNEYFKPVTFTLRVSNEAEERVVRRWFEEIVRTEIARHQPIEHVRDSRKERNHA